MFVGSKSHRNEVWCSQRPLVMAWALPPNLFRGSSETGKGIRGREGEKRKEEGIGGGGARRKISHAENPCSSTREEGASEISCKLEILNPFVAIDTCRTGGLSPPIAGTTQIKIVPGRTK